MSMYQEIIREGEPSGARPIEVNPPTFRWPAAGRAATYDVQYARSHTFDEGGGAAGAAAGDAVEGVYGLVQTFYRPLAPLEPGRWYWRYRVEGGPWSKTYSFEIPDEAVRWPLPPWSEALAKVPAAHPRLWVRPESAAELRAWAADPKRRADLEAWCAEAKGYLNRALPLEHDKPRIQTKDYNERIRHLWGAIADVKQTMIPAGELAFLYLLTGERDFAREAIRRVTTAARLNPDGYTSFEASDFANGVIVRNAALVYDYLFEHMSEEERAAAKGLIRIRMEPIYARYRPGLEQRPYNAHAWQHIMTDFMVGALAVYGELPEAAEWFDWGLRMFVAFYPWWGGKDGGSAETAEYLLGMSLISSHLNAVLIERATGIDLMAHPWYQGNADYIIYAHPPGGLRSQFGDYRAQGRPAPHVAVAMSRYAARFGNPYAVEYARRVGGKVGGKLESAEARMLAFLTPPLEFPEPRPLGELPKAKAFHDIGVVFMHSDIERPDRNVMFEFKSSPFGSFNHNHGDQNSFNIIAYDEMLALDSGYYIGYGDAHHVGWTVTTAAHNALLIDGKGQASRNIDAYGRIVDFYTGEMFHYAVGSAATAYRDVGVRTFLRRVLWVDCGLYLIVDEVETEEPTTTEWLLHALKEMEIDPEGGAALVRAGEARLHVAFVYPTPLTISQTSEFAVPPDNPVHGKREDFPDQWHLTATSREKRRTHYWVVALTVGKSEEIDRDLDRLRDVRRLSGNAWLGLSKSVPGGTLEAGFSTTGAPAEIELGDVRAVAHGLAIHRDDAGRVRMFSENARAIWLSGREILSSKRPITVEVVVDGDEAKMIRGTSDATILGTALSRRATQGTSG